MGKAPSQAKSLNSQKKNHAQSRIPTGNKQYKDSKALNKNNKTIQMRKMKNKTQ